MAVKVFIIVGIFFGKIWLVNTIVIKRMSRSDVERKDRQTYVYRYTVRVKLNLKARLRYSSMAWAPSTRSSEGLLYWIIININDMMLIWITGCLGDLCQPGKQRREA